MTQYFRTKEMIEGTGFRCYNCGKKLLEKIEGSYKVYLKCPRCHAEIIIKMNEPVEWSNKTEQAVK